MAAFTGARPPRRNCRTRTRRSQACCFPAAPCSSCSTTPRKIAKTSRSRSRPTSEARGESRTGSKAIPDRRRRRSRNIPTHGSCRTGPACFTQVTGRASIGHRDKQALCWLLALAAVFLYPFALGWTRFDPYALGYGSIEFVTALLLVTFAAWWARLDLIVFVIVAAALAYLAGAYESRTLWNTLIDPLVALYAMVRLLAAAALSRSP